MHEVLLRQVGKARGANKRPGEYKDQQNWIGALEIKRARFIPPPPLEAQHSMDELEAFINDDKNGIPTLIGAGLAHYQFETIHPFGDGNGRVGRMLITLQLLCSGLLKSPLLYVSPHIEAHKDEYIDSMFAVSTDGNWEKWLRFFLRSVKESSENAVDTILKLNRLQEKYRVLIQQNSKSISAITICDSLFERPVLSITQAAEISKTSYQAAKKNVDQLVTLGILMPIQGFDNPKLFWSKEIIDVSDGVNAY